MATLIKGAGASGMATPSFFAGAGAVASPSSCGVSEEFSDTERPCVSDGFGGTGKSLREGSKVMGSEEVCKRTKTRI